ncbi:hypothetical protein CK224_29280 [Mesorhizobium sp. WSM3862]|nr:hypothetical protein CK224_29280 [Mesorhizobium sp. WSM3862]
MNFGRQPEHEVPHVNLKYFHYEHQCLSAWRPEELKALSAFVGKLRKSKWHNIQMSGGSLGHKTGFGYTPHKNRNSLPSHPEIDKISEDITFFELRVAREMRVHGFRCLDAFYLVWLDKDHEVYS